MAGKRCVLTEALSSSPALDVAWAQAMRATLRHLARTLLSTIWAWVLTMGCGPRSRLRKWSTRSTRLEGLLAPIRQMCRRLMKLMLWSSGSSPHTGGSMQ